MSLLRCFLQKGAGDARPHSNPDALPRAGQPDGRRARRLDAPLERPLRRCRRRVGRRVRRQARSPRVPAGRSIRAPGLRALAWRRAPRLQGWPSSESRRAKAWSCHPGLRSRTGDPCSSSRRRARAARSGKRTRGSSWALFRCGSSPWRRGARGASLDRRAQRWQPCGRTPHVHVTVARQWSARDRSKRRRGACGVPGRAGPRAQRSCVRPTRGDRLAMFAPPSAR